MPIRRPAAIAFAAGLVVIVGGTAGLLLSHHSTPALRPVAAGASALPAPTGPIVAPPQSADPAPVARPVSLTIPLIGVKTSLITLGLASGGAMQVPSSVAVAGWYTGSPRPGSIGSSVIVGHVNSTTTHGVFYRLSELKAGDDVFVKRADGTTAEFRVTRIQTYPKDQFPTQTVYGPVPDAELRLITCGGAFDAATHHYLNNVVVYATEVKLAPGCPGANRLEPLLTPR
jgi:LPXTG-site transpeptidase (sortase) family protein